MSSVSCVVVWKTLSGTVLAILCTSWITAWMKRDLNNTFLCLIWLEAEEKKYRFSEDQPKLLEAVSICWQPGICTVHSILSKSQLARTPNINRFFTRFIVWFDCTIGYYPWPLAGLCNALINMQLKPMWTHEIKVKSLWEFCLMIYLHVRHVVPVIKTGQILPIQHLVYLLLTALWEIKEWRNKKQVTHKIPDKPCEKGAKERFLWEF